MYSFQREIQASYNHSTMLPKTKQVGGIELADGLFKDIKFYLIGTIDDKVSTYNDVNGNSDN